jgi:hypothetical protein
MWPVTGNARQFHFLPADAHFRFGFNGMSLSCEVNFYMGLSADVYMAVNADFVYLFDEQEFPVSFMGLMTRHALAGNNRSVDVLIEKVFFVVALIT